MRPPAPVSVTPAWRVAWFSPARGCTATISRPTGTGTTWSARWPTWLQSRPTLFAWKSPKWRRLSRCATGSVYRNIQITELSIYSPAAGDQWWQQPVLVSNLCQGVPVRRGSCQPSTVEEAPGTGCKTWFHTRRSIVSSVHNVLFVILPIFQAPESKKPTESEHYDM